MAANRNPIFPATIKTSAAQILPADTTVAKTLVTPGADGTNIKAIGVVSDDTATETIILSLLISAVSYKIGESVIAIGSGTNGTAHAVNLLNSVDATYLNADGTLDLAFGSVLQIAAKATITAAKTLNVVAHHGDY